MTRRYVSERRRRNCEVAAIDAKNRCRLCKLNLLTVPVVFTTLDGDQKFCSPECRDQWLGVEEAS